MVPTVPSQSVRISQRERNNKALQVDGRGMHTGYLSQAGSRRPGDTELLSTFALSVTHLGWLMGWVT